MATRSGMKATWVSSKAGAGIMIWNIAIMIQAFVEKCISQELQSAATKLPWRCLFSKECMASDLMASRTCQFVEFDLAVIVLCSPGFPRCHKFDD